MRASGGKKKGAKAKKGNGQRDSLAIVVNPRGEQRFFNSEARAPAHLRRRLTRVSNATGAVGVAFAYAESTGNVVNALEWANLSPSYQSYRVRAIKVTVVPRNFNNMSFAATVWYPGSVVSARYPSGSSAATIYAMWAEGGSKVNDCQKPFWQLATMQDNPDAALFTDCNAGAPPALSQYGVQFLGTVVAPAIYNGVITHDTFTEWDVEFIARN